VNLTDDMPDSQITIRRVNPAIERNAVLRLLGECLPEAASEDRFDWAYLNNPDGIALVWLAETADGEAVGTSAAFPRQFRVNGDTVRALVLSDFAIDRRFRTLGPAVGLLRATLAPIDDGRFVFALDHPSEAMAAVYRRLGGAELGRQTRYVRLIKFSGVARRRWGTGLGSSIVGSLGDITLRAIDWIRQTRGGLAVNIHSGKFDNNFDKLAGVLEECGVIFGDRRFDYLNWRFQSGIRFTYITITVRAAGELLAYAVLRRADSTSMTIVEFVCPAKVAIERALIGALVDISRRHNVESLQASCVEGSTWSTILSRLGFSGREQSAGAVVYTPKDAKWSDILTDKDQWWLTDGDRDG
jgi:hypothetical protein